MILRSGFSGGSSRKALIRGESAQIKPDRAVCSGCARDAGQRSSPSLPATEQTQREGQSAVSCSNGGFPNGIWDDFRPLSGRFHPEPRGAERGATRSRAVPSPRVPIGGIVRFRPPGRKNGRFRAWIRGIVRFPGFPERPSRTLRAPFPAARDRHARKDPGQGPVRASRRGRGGGRSSCPEDHRRTIPRFDRPLGRETCPGIGNRTFPRVPAPEQARRKALHLAPGEVRACKSFAYRASPNTRTKNWTKVVRVLPRSRYTNDSRGRKRSRNASPGPFRPKTPGTRTTQPTRVVRVLRLLRYTNENERENRSCIGAPSIRERLRPARTARTAQALPPRVNSGVESVAFAASP